MQAEGILGNLISSFRKILKDLNFNQNKRKSEKKEKPEVFSIQYQKQIDIPWKEQLDLLKNLKEEED